MKKKELLSKDKRYIIYNLMILDIIRFDLILTEILN